MQFLFTKEQIDELKTVHRAIKDKKDADKIKAVYCLAIGDSLQEITKRLMLDKDTIARDLKLKLISIGHMGSIKNVIKKNLWVMICS